VIDDCSEDRRLAVKLRELAGRGAFELIRNDRNLGFALTVNVGIGLLADRDVVLVNSDTEAYGDWLDRLNRAAYREDRVATVTPLSNNATICSYPRWLEDNRQALELSFAELDGLASEANRELAIDAPTGVGFCMYIRRAALDEVGAMDERFSAGYGEENDLCMRASAAGWKNVIAADVFVRHLGEVSFGAEAAKKREQALSILLERYPSYEQQVADYIEADPVFPARLRLDLARLRRAAPHLSAPAVLMVHHDWGGGVQVHVDLLTDRLVGEGVNVYWLKPSPAPEGEVHSPSLAICSPQLGRLPNCGNLSIELRREELAMALRALRVGHVHLHHIVGSPDGLLEWLACIRSDIGCTLDITLHDYTPVCPRIHLQDDSGHYCGEPDLAGCERCVADRGSPFGPQSVEQWRERWRPLMSQARRVLCPSHDVATRTGRYFPEAQYLVRPNPEPRFPEQPLPRPRGSRKGLRVAVPGAIGDTKGFFVLLDCAKDARRRRLPIEYQIVGYSQNDARAGRACVKVTGRFDPADADEALASAGCDIALYLSLWPETYSFTLSSAFRIGLFPVVLDMGALAERVREVGFGEVLPFELARDPAAINDALLALEVAPPDAPLEGSFLPGRYPTILRDYYDGLELA
jgi:glycosyltransferase involved in cell wall biosynthesis